MGRTTSANPARKALPDYEATLRKNARSVLIGSGVPPDQVDAEWGRLRDAPFLLELPTDEELDAITEGRATRDSSAAE